MVTGQINHESELQIMKNWQSIEEAQTQSTKLSSIAPEGSTGRRPVINSKSMTPYEKTSDFSDNLPLDAYSGAKYLHTLADFSVLKIQCIEE